MKKILTLFLIGMLTVSYGLFAKDITPQQDATQEEVASEQEPQKEPAAPEQKPEPEQDTSVASLYSDPWAYMKDEILEVPGYLSACFFPAKLGGAVGALAALAQGGVKMNASASGIDHIGDGLALRNYPQRFLAWISSKFDWFCGGATQGHAKLGGLFTKILLIATVFGGYKLTNYAIDTMFYGFALSNFLYHYPKRNRKLTPPSLRKYFDDEYEKYLEGRFSYMLLNTRDVVAFVEKAVAMHEANIKLERMKQDGNNEEQ